MRPATFAATATYKVIIEWMLNIGLFGGAFYSFISCESHFAIWRCATLDAIVTPVADDFQRCPGS